MGLFSTRFFGDRRDPAGALVADNFDAWFGNSKASDSDGPWIVFRGDKEPVDVYGSSDRRELGLFFAMEKDRAAVYGNPRPFFLKMEKPLDLRDAYGAWMGQDIEVKSILESLFEDHLDGLHSPETGEPYRMEDLLDGIESGDLWRMEGVGGFSMSGWRGLQRLAHANGFDGLVVPDGGEGIGVGVSVVVFDSSQAKLALENLGFYNGENPSVSDDPEVLRSLLRLKKSQNVISCLSNSLSFLP